MFAVFKREFKSLFQNVIGWIFLAVVIAVYELYFSAYNLFQGSPYVAYAISAALFIFLIAIPILTMRIFAEEKRTKTDQLILTAPVSLGKIVFGKFLALAAVHSIVAAVIAISPLVLRRFGTVPMGEAYVGVLGIWLYGLACVAICTFVSALTESQVLAAVLGFLALFLGFMMNSITAMVSSSDNLFTKILNCYDLYNPVAGFFSGYIDITSIIYFISIIALFLFLTYEAIQKRRYDTTRKSISISAFSWAAVVVAIASVVFVNLIVRELPSNITKIDVTDSKLYSITDDTKDFLKELNKDVDIYVLCNEANGDNMVAQTLEKYDEFDHVTVTYIDPSKNPTFAEQYFGKNTQIYQNSLIVVSGDKAKLVNSNDFYVYETNYSTYQSEVTGYDAEGLITSAINYVVSEQMPVVYVLEGHDEIALESSFTDVIEKANYELEELNLLTVDEVPDDCSVLIINGPGADLSSDDAKKVINFINEGGNVLITLSYDIQSKMPNIDSVLDELGLKVIPGLVAENNQNYYYQSPFYLLPYVNITDASENVYGGTSIFMPYTVALDVDDDETVQTIINTSTEAISKTDYMTATSLDPVEGDTEGELTLGITKITSGGGTAIVYGSYMLLTDSTNEMVAGKNAKLFADNLTYMMQDMEGVSEAVVIPSKEYTVGNLTISAATTVVHFVLWVVILPLALIASGIIIWAIRRKK